MHLKNVLTILVLPPMVLILLCPFWVGADSSSGNRISLHLTNQPLSHVLDRLSQITGKRLIYDENWADENISVKIVNQDLDKALRKILNSYNYGIIYGDDGSIRIMVYGEKDSATSVTSHNRSPVEYGHVGSADIQIEENIESENAPENETQPGISDASEVDRENESEEDPKRDEDDSEAVAESTETDTEGAVEEDADKDNEQSRILQTE